MNPLPYKYIYTKLISNDPLCTGDPTCSGPLTDPSSCPLVKVDSDMMELIQLLFLKLLGYSDIVKEFMDMRRLSKSFSLGNTEFRASFTDLLSLVCTEGR